MKLLLLVILVLSSNLLICQAEQIIKSESGYDHNKPPLPESGDPLDIGISLSLAAILEIDEPKQAITVEVILRFNWTDHRINVSLPANDSLGFVLSTKGEMKDLWYPDIHIPHAKATSRPFVLLPPSYLRIYPNGGMFYAMSANYEVSCPMDFLNYPIDIQTCPIRLESWGMTSDILKLHWDGYRFPESIRLNQHEALLNFSEGVAEYSTGSFPTLLMNIELQRSLSYHLVRTYLPSILFVILAWLSIFIPIDLLPARIGLSITTLLTLASMFGSLSSITPPVSYTTKLDIWIISCFVFVSSMLIETALVVYVKFHLSPPMAISLRARVDKVAQAWQENNDEIVLDEERLSLAGKIDKIVAVASFVAFSAFSCFYWIDLMTT